MRRGFLIVAGALSLAGCGPTWQAAMDCRAAAGPEPGSGLTAFGAIGAAIMVAAPEHRLWRSDVDHCIARYREAQRR